MQSKKISKEFSNKAIFISFIMPILVIYIHANNLAYYNLTSNESEIANIVVKIVGTIFAGNAVPYFFIMSGFWFFRKDTQKLVGG